MHCKKHIHFTHKNILLCILILLLNFPAFSQISLVTVSGIIKDKKSKEKLPYVNLELKNEKDSIFVAGTVTKEDGAFTINNVKPGTYSLDISYAGYNPLKQTIFIGSLSEFLILNDIEIESETHALNEVTITGTQDLVNQKMDKKTFTLEENVSQRGGSVLQSMQNLPGVTVQDGRVQLRGNEKVTVLIDGKQTALTGFGDQKGLDNIPASAIERIEIINNPSSKYDANGNAGIINIIYKKNKQEGFTGKAGIAMGLGALWVRKQNLPTIRPQYSRTPKFNPTLSLNYRKNKFNLNFQGDYLYTQTLNKNEFITRVYNDNTTIQQQLKRNRNTHFTTLKAGLDYALNDFNSITISGLYGSEKIIDRGDQPFFNDALTERARLWQFLEDELKTTFMGTMAFQHKFKSPGHVLNMGYNYTFHREDEKYFFDNIQPTFTGKDAFKLLSDESVSDFNVDYIKPLKYGRFETGIKFRKRDIPTNMQFFAGLNSPVDTQAGGWANYKEIIPAVYGNYMLENKYLEAEMGLRMEYVRLNYEVNPNHITYKSNGYDYIQPFPTLRLAYKINDLNKLSFFYNRRVDRPAEVDIRIFPKYDDAEIVKVGNPDLRPQFTNSLELGYKTSWNAGYFYLAGYNKIANATITRISSAPAGSKIIYAIFQNVNKSYNTGLELVFNQKLSQAYSMNLNLNGYHNQIDAFQVINLYPVVNNFSAPKQEIVSGNIKLNNIFHLAHQIDLQLTAIYLAPDIIPQGKIFQRYSLDFGIKKLVQKGKGEIFINATDVLNSMVIKKRIQGEGFYYTSSDYYETQVLRIGYSYKF